MKPFIISHVTYSDAEGKMNAMVSHCPVCTGGLHVTELACGGCGTRISGQFEASRFGRLNREQQQLIEMFLANRGNLSSTADELGVSFPTVSRRLDAALATLGLAPEPVASPRGDAERARILDQLDRGDITADEAARRLATL